ncbi:MAG: 4Fe-4S cluster-binding domain-containing protein, partial [Lachnospiraceae bacterium]|nr:4Fe-4S cluster-binding domain-containing protein [Lachnospiraceae bacterium]
MEIIKRPIPAVLTVLGTQPDMKPERCKESVFSIHVPCKDGILLYHSLTGELLLLTTAEYTGRISDPALYNELVKRFYLVDGRTDEVKLCNQTKKILKAIKPQSKIVKNYTIFTTTDCNARCYYCFEMGQRRIKMSEKTAGDVADYISRSCDKEKVSIRWFGGEPLFNIRPIDIISDRLHKSGISFESHIVTNGYLFDQEIIRRAKSKWMLKYAIVTLDGTEKTYNTTKAYIYKDQNPFRRVLDNIEDLLRAGIGVIINLNMDADNAGDLDLLIEELAKRYRNYPDFSVRCALLEEYAGNIHHFASQETAFNT